MNRRLLPGNIYEYKAYFTHTGITTNHIDKMREDVDMEHNEIAT